MSDNKMNTVTTNQHYNYVKHPSGNGYICPVCKVYKEKQNTMHYHMKTHINPDSYKCKTCGKSFLQKQTLLMHINAKHPSEIETPVAEYACPFAGCTFQASSKGNCKIHCLRTHFQDEIGRILEYVQNDIGKIIRCRQCRKEFNSLGSFYYHVSGCMVMPMANDKRVILNSFK
jgi:hypothetical protein